MEEISAEQREGIVNYIQREDILAVLPTGYGKSLLFQLLPVICHALNTMGYKKKPFYYLHTEIYSLKGREITFHSQAKS